MGADYNHLGFDSFLRPKISTTIEPRKVTNYEFDSQYDVSGKSVKLSNVSVDKMVQLSDSAAASGTGFVNGDDALILAVLEPSGAANYLTTSRMHMAIPYITIYEGGTDDPDNQIYPRQGDNIANGDYECMAGWDRESVRWNGVNVTYAVTVKVIAAGTVDLYVKNEWQYTRNNFGAAEQ